MDHFERPKPWEGVTDGLAFEEAMSALYPRVQDVVGPAEVLEDVPNLGSIAASLTEYEVLPHIYWIPLTHFGGPDTYVAADDNARVDRLAEQIRTNGRVAPLIVVIDAEGPYVLEGGHRYDAIHRLEWPALPALVVLDTESIQEAIEANRKPRPTRRQAR